jgi:energy-coupling factor transporter ATP-binding protein EcfA2
MQDATLIDDRFQIIAVGISENTNLGRRGLKENLYYFYRGYQIIDNGNVIKCERGLSDCEQVFNDYLVEQSLKASKTKTVPRISISAIVGKNGSGKSTIVEFVLRLINNFSAMMFGEQLAGEGLEHLHYIDGVGGELYWSMDERFYKLTVIGRQIELDCYEIDEDNEENQDVYKIVPSRKLMVDQDDVEPILDAYGEVEQMMPYLEHFFYTVVSNYVIYAYNTLDYLDENNTVEYERKIYQEANVIKANEVKIDPSQCNWYHGIFHKNDGYKTPLVLTPYRNKGNININIENTL